MAVSASLVQRIDAVIDRALDEGRIVGTVVPLEQNRMATYQRAAGYADREAAVATSTGTLFRLASLAKPIVAATALAISERGGAMPR